MTISYSFSNSPGVCSCNRNGLFSENGFSIVELLYTMFLLSILSSIAIVSYSEYKEDAEYKKVESTLRNARTALVAGEQDVNGAFGLGFTDTGTNGGPVPLVLQEILPGLVTDSDVVLTFSYNSCPAGAGIGVVNAVIICKPCKAQHYSVWERFCDGTEVENRHQFSLIDFC